MWDLILDYHEAIQLVKEVGYDGWLSHIAAKFPDRHLYSASTDWFTHGSKFIAKLRGTSGDVVVGWKGVHHP